MAQGEKEDGKVTAAMLPTDYLDMEVQILWASEIAESEARLADGGRTVVRKSHHGDGLFFRVTNIQTEGKR